MLRGEQGQGALHPRSESDVFHATAFVCVSMQWTFCKYPPPGGLWRGTKCWKVEVAAPSCAVLSPRRHPCRLGPQEWSHPLNVHHFLATAISFSSWPCGAHVHQEEHVGMVAGRAVAMYGRAMVVVRWQTSTTSLALGHPREEAEAIF